jgi:hypothetical protein
MVGYPGHQKLGSFRTIGLGRPEAAGLSPIRNPTTPPKADAGCPVPFRKSAIRNRRIGFVLHES